MKKENRRTNCALDECLRLQLLVAALVQQAGSLSFAVGTTTQVSQPSSQPEYSFGAFVGQRKDEEERRGRRIELEWIKWH